MSTVMLFVRFFPLVIEVVRSLEAVFPQKGFGGFKLSIATSVLSHAYDLLSGGFSKEALMAKLPTVISDVVGEMNKKPEAWIDPATVATK